MKFSKLCPSCGKLLCYSAKNKLTRSVRENSFCGSCSKSRFYRKQFDLDIKKELVDNIWMFYRICPVCNEKTFYKIRGHRNQLEKQNSPCRKCFKMSCVIYPRFNYKACKFFDLINQSNKWNGVHALNGGEYYIERFHYFLDYYEQNLNLVIEWNELHHKYQKIKDEIRKQNIIDVLGCRFLTIDESTKIEDIKI